MVYKAEDKNPLVVGDKYPEEMRQAGSIAEVNIVAEFDNLGTKACVA